jgi:hypothetical protein
VLKRLLINRLLDLSIKQVRNTSVFSNAKSEAPMTDFFYKLGRATGMAKQAMQKTVAEEHEGIASLPGHGTLTTLVTEKPDGTRILLLKAKGAEAAVYVGFDKEQLAALSAHLGTIKL